MLTKVTMAFMLLLSQQPNLMVSFTKDLREAFPYECFRLSGTYDESGDVTFMLIPEKDCEVKH